MKRNISFRAWDKIYKAMIYEIQKEYDTVAGIRYEGTNKEPGGCCFNYYLNNDRFIVMQDSGLLDRDKKRIFEGDFVLWNKVLYEVIFDMNCPGYYVILPNKQLERLYKSRTEKYFQVIGNIYSDLELFSNSDILKKY